MPDGSTASGNSVAPAQSPTAVLGLDLARGGYLTFSATGAVNNNGGIPGPTDNRPDGGFSDGNFAPATHFAGAQNGIANVQMPINALMGVFLTDSRPDLTAAPPSVDFLTNLDYVQISPELKQPFFIGDGLTGIKTGTGQVQRVNIPSGATRLFLGPLDQDDFLNNEGGFVVHVSYHP